MIYSIRKLDLFPQHIPVTNVHRKPFKQSEGMIANAAKKINRIKWSFMENTPRRSSVGEARRCSPCRCGWRACSCRQPSWSPRLNWEKMESYFAVTGYDLRPWKESVFIKRQSPVSKLCTNCRSMTSVTERYKNTEEGYCKWCPPKRNKKILKKGIVSDVRKKEIQNYWRAVL